MARRCTARPTAGRARPDILSSVDLPLPLLPIIAIISPLTEVQPLERDDFQIFGFVNFHETFALNHGVYRSSPSFTA